MSDCENHSAEWAAFYEITQPSSRFGQREGLSHNRFDRAGFKQRDDYVPSFSLGRLRLSEHVETPDAGLWHDEICHVNGCLTACGIPQCCEAASQRKRSERLAQDFTSDSVDDDVCAVAARDTTHAVSQLLQGGVDDFIESERLRLLGFRTGPTHQDRVQIITLSTSSGKLDSEGWISGRQLLPSDGTNSSAQGGWSWLWPKHRWC